MRRVVNPQRRCDTCDETETDRTTIRRRQATADNRRVYDSRSVGLYRDRAAAAGPYFLCTPLPRGTSPALDYGTAYEPGGEPVTTGTRAAAASECSNKTARGADARVKKTQSADDSTSPRASNLREREPRERANYSVVATPMNHPRRRCGGDVDKRRRRRRRAKPYNMHQSALQPRRLPSMDHGAGGSNRDI